MRLPPLSPPEGDVYSEAASGGCYDFIYDLIWEARVFVGCVNLVLWQGTKIERREIVAFAVYQGAAVRVHGVTVAVLSGARLDVFR